MLQFPKVKGPGSVALTKELYDLKGVKELQANEDTKRKVGACERNLTSCLPRLKKKLKKKGTDLRFVTPAELFGVIHDAHLAFQSLHICIILLASAGID